MFGIMGRGVRARLAILVGIAVLAAMFCAAVPNGRLHSQPVAQSARHSDAASSAMRFSGLRIPGRRVFVEDTPPPSPQRLEVAKLQIPLRRDAMARVTVPLMLHARVPPSNRQRAP
jgi:hypothetical protein